MVLHPICTAFCIADFHGLLLKPCDCLHFLIIGKVTTKVLDAVL